MRIIDASNNLALIDDFLERAKNSLETFRYFEKRPLSVVKNHVTTLIILEEKKPVCYGHLDDDGTKVWLGIAVIGEHRGRGYGKIMMNELIERAKSQNLNAIYLSVDKSNTIAQALYEKKGFKVFDEKEGENFMKLDMP
ncbi:MAG: GNAT family N-acetyltransferase [Balneolales bacterium]